MAHRLTRKLQILHSQLKLNLITIASRTNNPVLKLIVIRFVKPQLAPTTMDHHLTNHKWILAPDYCLHRPRPSLTTLLTISSASIHNKFYHLVLFHMQYYMYLINSTSNSTTTRILLMPTKVTMSITVEVLLRNEYNCHERKKVELEVGQPQVKSLIQWRKSLLKSKEASSGLLPICLKRTTMDSETSS